MSKIDLGGLELDSEVLESQIRKDLKDDWFKDPLEFEDILDEENIAKKILGNIEHNHGEYIPSPVSIFDIPKKNFTLRYTVEKSIIDRIYYHGIAVFLKPYFEPLLSSRSFSHRLQPDRKKRKKYLFKNGVEQWNEFRGSVRAKLPGKYLLETDINSYFEGIEIHHIKESLIHMLGMVNESGTTKMKIRRAIDILFDCLPSWTYEPNKGKGLPQNRDASSFLANVLLHSVDEEMIENGYDYHRYMDDIKVVCNSEYEARKALMDLVIALRKKGLGL